jgi:hypothetical protein
VRAVPIPFLRLANGYPNILATLGYASGMSTTKEELHALVERVPADKAERVLELLKRTLDPPAPKSDELRVPGHDEPMNQVMRQHWRQVGDRIGLDVDQLPKNGGMSGGWSGNRVELTKDWESEDARHRLSKLDVQGHEIILLERMTAGEGSELGMKSGFSQKNQRGAPR